VSHNRHYRMAATMSTDRHTVLQLARMHTQETVFFINSYHQHSYDAESQKKSPIQLCRKNELSPFDLCLCPPKQHRYPQLLKT